MATQVERPVTAVLVGVSAPAPFTYRGTLYRFGTLSGVAGDLDWYESFLRRTVPATFLTLQRWDSPAATTPERLRTDLRKTVTGLPTGALMVLVLCGHGFQATDDNGDEPDHLDEVFAATGGPVLDDDFGRVWDATDPSVDVVVIVDTCSADSLAIRGGREVEPVLAFRSLGPSRLSISASMAWEKAGEVAVRHGVRGALSLALEDAWAEPEARVSYLAWFRAAAQLLAVRRPQQHPRLRYLGPDDRLLERAPLT
jgi:hypothetical protein